MPTPETDTLPVKGLVYGYVALTGDADGPAAPGKSKIIEPVLEGIYPSCGLSKRSNPHRT